MVQKRPADLLAEPGLRHGIRIEHQNDVTRGSRRAQVVGDRETGVSLQFDQLRIRKMFRNYRAGRVRGVIVDHKHFVTGHQLAGKCGQGPGELLTRSVGDDQVRDRWPVGIFKRLGHVATLQPIQDKRTTGLEPATSSLGSSRSTN